jgi:hypothetical protein
MLCRQVLYCFIFVTEFFYENGCFHEETWWLVKVELILKLVETGSGWLWFMDYVIE